MKISRLLELHRQSNPAQSLVLNFGDGFLLHNNSIYRNVRTRATALGFNYTKDVSPEYLALPLSQLAKILQEKSIPYFDNVSVLNEVKQKIPQTTM